jgi:hypothetical protein
MPDEMLTHSATFNRFETLFVRSEKWIVVRVAFDRSVPISEIRGKIPVERFHPAAHADGPRNCGTKCHYFIRVHSRDSRENPND